MRSNMAVPNIAINDMQDDQYIENTYPSPRKLRGMGGDALEALLKRIDFDTKQENDKRDALDYSVGQLETALQDMERYLERVDLEGNEWKTRWENQVEINRDLEKQIHTNTDRIEQLRNNIHNHEPVMSQYDQVEDKKWAQLFMRREKEVMEMEEQLKELDYRLDQEGKIYYMATAERKDYGSELRVLDHDIAEDKRMVKEATRLDFDRGMKSGRQTAQSQYTSARQPTGYSSRMPAIQQSTARQPIGAQNTGRQPMGTRQNTSTVARPNRQQNTSIVTQLNDPSKGGFTPALPVRDYGQSKNSPKSARFSNKVDVYNGHQNGDMGKGLSGRTFAPVYKKDQGDPVAAVKAKHSGPNDPRSHMDPAKTRSSRDTNINKGYTGRSRSKETPPPDPFSGSITGSGLKPAAANLRTGLPGSVDRGAPIQSGYNVPQNQRIIDSKKGPIKKQAAVRRLPSIGRSDNQSIKPYTALETY